MNLPLPLSAALLAAACNSVPEREPVLVVARLGADGTCQVCPRTAGELPCGLSDDGALLAAIGHDDCAAAESCVFEAGWDEALLVAVLGRADAFDGYLGPGESVSVTTVQDGTQSAVANAALFASAEAGGSCSFVYAAPQLALTTGDDATIRWVLADGGDLDLYSKTYEVRPAGVCATIAPSTGPVIAGVTRMTVTADVPAKYPVESLQVAQLINGVVADAANFAPAEAVTTDLGKRLTKSFVAAAQPFARYRVELRGVQPGAGTTSACGATGATAAEFDLQAPKPLQLALVDGDVADDAVDFGQGVQVARIAAEPVDDCRQLKLGIKAEGLPTGSTLTLTTDAGSLDNSGSTIVRPLPADGELVTPLRLPATRPSASEVHLSATFGAATRGDLALAFAPVYADDWKALTTTSPTVQVDATGSPALSLKGRLFAPGGVEFLPGYRLDVHVEPSAGGVPAKCGPAIPASLITCDPAKQGGGGGCALADTSVTVAADGSFTIDLSAGACFIGQVRVYVRGPAYRAGEDAKPCIGERLFEQTDMSEIVLDYTDAP